MAKDGFGGVYAQGKQPRYMSSEGGSKGCQNNPFFFWITLTEDTDERLRQYAYEQHTTMSGVITKMIWEAKVKYDQMKGQCSFDLGAEWL